MRLVLLCHCQCVQSLRVEVTLPKTNLGIEFRPSSDLEQVMLKVEPGSLRHRAPLPCLGELLRVGSGMLRKVQEHLNIYLKPASNQPVRTCERTSAKATRDKHRLRTLIFTRL